MHWEKMAYPSIRNTVTYFYKGVKVIIHFAYAGCWKYEHVFMTSLTIH